MKYIVKYSAPVGPAACLPYLIECRGQAYEGQFEVRDIAPAASQWGTERQEVVVEDYDDFDGLRTLLTQKWLGVREGEEWHQARVYTCCDPVAVSVGDSYENHIPYGNWKKPTQVAVTGISDPYELGGRSFVDVEVSGHAGNDLAFEHGAIELLRGGPLVRHKQPVQNGPVQNGPGWSKTDRDSGGNIPDVKIGTWGEGGVI